MDVSITWLAKNTNKKFGMLIWGITRQKHYKMQYEIPICKYCMSK